MKNFLSFGGDENEDQEMSLAKPQAAPTAACFGFGNFGEVFDANKASEHLDPPRSLKLVR